MASERDGDEDDGSLGPAFEAAPEAMLVVDGETGAVLEANGAASDLFGESRDRLCEQSLRDRFADDPTTIRRRAADGESVTTVLELHSGNRWVEASIEALGDGSDRLLVFLTAAMSPAVDTDLGDRTPRETTAILSQLTATEDIVFWLFEGAFEELRFVNDAYEDIWGRPVEALRTDPQDFLSGIHPDHRERALAGMEQMSEGKVVELEYRVNPEEDYGRWVWVRSEPFLGPDGHVEQVAGIARDITERKERERQLERSNERLEQFAYVASHDLQEPLRTITNYLELLEEEYGDAFDEEGERFMDVVLTGSERMQSMINGLLDYSRITTRGREFEPVDTGAVVEDVVSDLDLLLDDTEGTVEWGDLPAVEGDPDQLRQLVQNLVKNALEHADGAVTVEVRGREAGDHYRFEVEDDGPGIEPSRQEKIFRMFKSSEQYQTSSQAKGIGLAVCDSIVQRHGGELTVESEPGDGATFVFTIAKQ